MSRLPWLAAGFLVLALPLASSAQEPRSSPVLIYVTVPADAKLSVNGAPTKQTGKERRLITPPLKFGEQGTYTLTASFKKDGKEVKVERDIVVEGGKTVRVDLTQDAPMPRAVDPKTDEPKKDKPKTDEPKKIDLGPSPKVDEPKKVDPVPPKVDEPKKVDPAPPKVDEPKKEVKVNVPYVPTPEKVVEEMLKLAGVKEGDVVYDLGCGDGRIVITAVQKYKAKKGLGVELSPDRVKLSRDNAQKAGVGDRVEIREGDVLKLTDLSEATVVTLYLLPDINEKLKPVLRRTLKPGARVVSHDFDMGDDWRPERDVTVKDETGRDHTLYLWTVKEPTKPAPPKKDLPPPLEKDRPPAKPAPFERDTSAPPKKPAPAPAAKGDEKTIKVPFVPTPQTVVEEMLKLAGVKEGDVVYDLGCGDGRIVISAVKGFKAKKGVGIDIDPARVADATRAAKDAGVEGKVEIRQGDVLKLDSVAEANVVTLYLFPEVNERLQPMLQRTLKPGSRVVSHDFLMRDDWKYDREITVKDAGGQEHTLYLWTIKERK